jgi:Dihaem cytochrome c
MVFFFKSPMDSNNSTMHTTELIKTVLRIPLKLVQLVAVGVAAASVAVMFVTSLASAQTPKPASKKTEETTTTTAKAEPLSGAELWAMNCNRCHMARNPGEFTAAQWRTIFRHMRIRANLPADQARQLQKYLEGGAGK